VAVGYKNPVHDYSISTKLLLIIAVAALPLVAAIGVLYYTEYQEGYSDAEHDILVATEALAQKHTAQVDGIRAQLATLAQFEEVRRRDKNGCARLLQRISRQNQAGGYIGIADRSGNVIASTESENANIGDSQYFRDALGSRRFSAASYSAGRFASNPAMRFAMPVLDASGRVTAVVSADVDLDSFGLSFASQSLPAGSAVNVSDARGTIVYRYPALPTVKAGLKDRPDLHTRMSAGQSPGVFRDTGADHLKRVLGYTRLQLDPNGAPYLYIRVSIPEQAILKHTYHYFYFAGAILISMALVTLICSALLARSFLIDPIKHLIEVARSFKDGDLSARTGFLHSCDEIGILAQSFDSMSESMEKRQTVLRASEHKFSSVFELSPITMALTGLDEGTFVEVNRQFSKTFGFTREEIQGRSTVELDLWANPQDRNSYIEKLQKDRFVSRVETVMRARNGDLITVEFTGSLLEINGTDYVLSSIIDITERKQAEKALHESENRFKEFFEQSGDAFLILSEGKFINCNKATVELLGYRSKDEVCNRAPAQLSPKVQPDGKFSQARVKELVELAFSAGSQRFEWTHQKADGSELPVEVVMTPMSLSKRMVQHVTWRDITERKRLELREQTRLKILEEMAAGAPLQGLLDAIVRFAEKSSPGSLCSILLANDEGTRLLKGSAPSLPDFYNDAVDGLKIKEGMGSCGTAAFLRKRVIVEDIRVHPYWKGFQPALDAGLRSCWSEPIHSPGGELLGTFAVYHREPRSPGADTITLIESAANLAGIAIGRVRDNQRHALLTEHLLQMQKFEAIGQLAGGIAHDFNNLLTPILVYAEMIRGTTAREHPDRKKIEGILAAANKSKDLTQRLLLFGRKQLLDMKGIDLNEVIFSFEEILGRTVRENIVFDMQLAPGGANIQADRGQMEQILLNLAVNSQDAIAGNGRVLVETGHVSFDEEYVRLNPGTKPGDYILLAVTDSGCGMTEEVLQHVFEPFFTTKAVGHGTGLGLATVYGIVKQHDGYIKIRSKVGEGTTFTIYLPECTALSKAPAGRKSPKPHQGEHDKTILFVDDNEMILAMAAELLAAHGFRTLIAATPAQALDLALSHQGTIDLLVTDVVMLEMNGAELYGRLAEQRSELPVLYISGYKNDVVLRGGTLEEEVNFLAKPFTAEQLTDKILHALPSGESRSAG
jgi:PAS domain S-box-containing protein